jgi:predicted nucleic acid-binding protein
VKLVVDASVAIKWAIDEDHHTVARALMAGDNELLAPDFALFEIANILWKKLRRKEIGRDQAMAAGPGISRVFTRLIPAATLVDQALRLAIELGHPVYDCLYLAAAHSESIKLLTADRRFASAVAGSQYSSLVVLLEAWVP